MKNTRILTAGIAVLATSGALAAMPTIKTQLRGDFTMDKTETTASQNAKKTEVEKSNFDMPYLRFDVKGKIKDGLTYRVKFRLNDSKGLQRDSVDTIGHGVDYAYVQKQINKMVKVKIGKQYFNLGGFEGMYSSKESYSQGSLSWNNSDYYRTGLGAFFKLGDHKFNFQAVNPDDTTANKDMAYGAQAVLSFANGMVKPLVSYHKDTTHNDLTAGLQFNMKGFKVEVDHTITEFDKTYNTNGTLAAKADEHTSTTVLVGYKMGKWAPQFKYATAETELDYKSFDSMHVALEYFPNNDGSLRYHVAYATSENEAKTTSSKSYKTEGTTLTTGFALSF